MTAPRRRRLLPAPASRGSGRAHRVFHPLCGATLPVLLGLLADGGVRPGRAHVAAIALGMATLRLPFTLGEAAWAGAALPRPGRYPAPVFIVGHWRSGTTHLANMLSRSGAFGILSPITVGLPAEARGLGRVAAPFIEQFFPRHRLIDEMALAPDLPQEDELAMANLSRLSCQHGVYFPRHLRAAFDRGLFGVGVSPREHALWARRLERFVAKMTAAAGRPLLIRNPASSTRIAALRAIWPEARFIHIHRAPDAVIPSAAAMFGTLLRELSLGRHDDADPGALVRHVYPRLMTALLDAADTLPTASLATVAHAALEHDPLGTARSLFETLDLAMPPGGEAAMAAYAAAHQRTARTRTLAPDDRAFLDAHRAIARRLGYDDRDAGAPPPRTHDAVGSDRMLA